MADKEKQERDDFNPSWFLVVLMLSVFWPVGLWFLWSKLQHLGESKEKGRKRGLTSGGIALFVLGAVFIMNSGGLNLGWFLGLGGVGMFLMNMFLNKREKKYRHYVSFIASRPVVELSEIASAVGVTEEDVRRDLQKMIEDGWFGEQAYLDLGRGLFIASAEYAPKEKVRPAKRAQAAPARKAPAPKAQPAPAPSHTENEYVQKLREIRALNDAIKDETVSAQIERIEQICGNIFEAVTVQPEKSSSAHTFLNYYLPTTLKLLSAYSRLEKQGIDGENINSAKKNIEDLLDRLVWAFERQNDQLFAQDAMDINADIKVMDTMLQKDGLSGGDGMPSDPFGEVLGRRGGAAVATKRKEN